MYINQHHHFGKGNEYSNVWYIYAIDKNTIIDCFDGWSNDCWAYIEEKYGINNIGKIAVGNIAEAKYLGMTVHY